MESVIFLFIERFYRSIAQIVHFCEFFHPGLQKLYFWLKITLLHVVMIALLTLPKDSQLCQIYSTLVKMFYKGLFL